MTENLQFGITGKSNIQGMVSDLTKGFDQILKNITRLAQGFQKLGAKDMQKSATEMAQSVSKMKDSLRGIETEQKRTANSSKLLQEALSEDATKYKAVGQAAQYLRNEIKKGTIDEKGAIQYLRNLQAGLDGYKNSTINATKTTESFNQEISFKTIRNLIEQDKALKLTANGFKILSNSAIDYLTKGEESRKEMRHYMETASLYEKALLSAADKTKAYGKAVQDLGAKFGVQNQSFRPYLNTLDKVEKALGVLKSKQDSMGKNTAWINNLNRTNVVLAVHQEKLKVTTEGLKALSQKGLEALGVKTIETAKDLGILHRSFDTFESKLKQIQSILGLTDKQFQTLRKDALSGGASFTELSKRADLYIRTMAKLDTVSGKVARLSLTYKTLLNSQTQQGAEARKLITTYQQEGKGYDILTIKLRNLKKQYDDGIRSKRAAEQAVSSLKARYLELINSQTKYAAGARKIIAAIGTQVKDLKRAENAVKILDKRWKEATYSAKGLAGAIDFVARSFKVYARYMIASSSLRAFTSTIGKMKDAVMDYDQTLHNLKAILNATQVEVDLMGKALLATTIRTKFSIEETGEAMKLLGQAGFSAMESFQAIDNVANLATGTLESLQETVKLVTTTIRAFSLGADQTGKVVDIFANAVNASRLTIERLNTSFNYLGPIAEAAGLTLKDVSASLMLLANSGVRASTSSTGLRRVLGLLANPTEAFQKAVVEAGYSMDEFDTRFNSMSSIISKLPKIVKSAGDAIEMFGLRGSTVVTAFANQGSEEFTRLKSKLDEVGAASRMAEEQMKGMQVTWKNVKDRVGALAVVMGESGFAGVLRTVLNLTKDFLGLLITISGNPIGKLIIGVTTLTASVFALIVTFRTIALLNPGGIFTKIGLAVAATNAQFLALPATILKVKASILALGIQGKAAMLSLATSIKSAALAMKAFLLNPIGAFITVTAVAIGSLVYAFNSANKAVKELAEQMMLLQTEINNTQDRIEKYVKATQDFGKFSDQSKESVIDLEEAVRKLGESGTLTSTEVDKFTTSINRQTGTIENDQQVIEELSDLIDNRYRKSVSDLIQKQERAAFYSRYLKDELVNLISFGFGKLFLMIKRSIIPTMDGMIRKFAETVPFIQKFVDLYEWLGDKVEKVTSFSFKRAGSAFNEFASNYLNWANGPGIKATRAFAKEVEQKYGWDIPESIFRTIESYVLLQEKIKKGEAGKNDITLFQSIDTQANEAVKSILKGRDAAKLLTEELESLARAKYPEGTDNLIGAIVLKLQEAQQNAKLTNNAFKEDLNNFIKDIQDAKAQGILTLDYYNQKYIEYQNKIVKSRRKEEQNLKGHNERLQRLDWDYSNALGMLLKRKAEAWKTLSKEMEEKLDESFVKIENTLKKDLLNLEKLAFFAPDLQINVDAEKARMELDSLKQKMVELENALNVSESLNKDSEVVEDLKKQIKELNQEISKTTFEEKKLKAENFADEIKKHEKAAKASADSIKKYEESIKSLRQGMVDQHRALEDKITELQRKGLSDRYKQNAAYLEAVASEKKIREQINKVIEEENKVSVAAAKVKQEASKENIENLRKVSEEYKSNMETINEETKYWIDRTKEGFDTASEGSAVSTQTIISHLKEIQKVADEGTESQIRANEMLAISEARNMKEQQDSVEELKKRIESIKNTIETFEPVKTLVSPEALNELNKAVEKMERLRKEISKLSAYDTDINVNIKEGSSGGGGGSGSYHEGGRTKHAASGMRFPGNSVRDSISVKARPGEGFVKNEALSIWDKTLGKGFFNGVMNPFGPQGQKIMEKMKGNSLNSSLIKSIQGMASKVGQFADMGSININIGSGNPIPIMGNISDLNELKKRLVEEQGKRYNS